MIDDFTEEHYRYQEKKTVVAKIVRYVMDHKYRKAVAVTPWIKEQLISPSDALNSIGKGLAAGTDNKTMSNVLSFVKRRVTYTGDHKVYGYAEKWQSAEETLSLGTGDCEDGAILMYVLARIAGIPAYKLQLLCGDVQGGGHCWLAYKPQPHFMVFEDWCYYFTNLSIEKRPRFYISGQDIVGDDPRYKTMWFGFNEEYSILEYKLR